METWRGFLFFNMPLQAGTCWKICSYGHKKRPDRKNSDPVFENSCKKLLLSGNDLKVGKFNLLAELPAESLFDGFIAHVIQLDGNHF